MDFIFDPSLVLYLPLYELDGASFVSKDAYERLCTVTGAMWTPQARYFDGTDDTIYTPSSLSLNPGLSDFSLEAWVKAGTDVATWRKIISMDDAASDRYCLYINQTSGTFIAEMRLDGTSKPASSGVAVSDNQWHHLVGTFDRDGYIMCYIDGIQRGTPLSISSLSAVGCNPNDNLTVGSARNSSQFFSGLIGEVRVYLRVLSPLEARRNYLATKWRYQ